ncbi:nucleotidyltransferase family protein [Helicobacter sp. T3_23-1056]
MTNVTRIRQAEIDLIEFYISGRLSKNDLDLLHLIFSQNPTQEQVDKFLPTYDIEVAGSYKALLLAYFAKMHPYLKFTAYETPRLKGLLNFYRFQNMKLIADFIKIGKVFRDNNIEMMVLKGFAMKCLRPDLSRAMGDIDILTFGQDFIKSYEIIQKMGYRMSLEPHSIDIHEPDSEAGVLDIHRWVNIDNGRGERLNKYLLKRARQGKINGLDILIPSNEDLFFLSLVNLSKNLRDNTSRASTLYALFDCKYLLEQPNFDFDIVFQNAKITKTEDFVGFGAKFINTIIPDLIPQGFYQESITKFCINILFTRYFRALQKVVRKIKFSFIAQGKISLYSYAKIKLYYKFCKYIANKDFIKTKEFLLNQRERTKRR